MLTVTKVSGEIEPFDSSKVIRALERAGVEEGLQREALEHLEQQLYDGIETRDIYQIIFDYLKKTRRHLAAKFSLKKAIMDLGPSGYPFEKFVAGLLETKGYKTEVNVTLQGKAVTHEIDVIAEDKGGRYLVECKFHQRGGIKSDVKVPMYLHSRFLDVGAVTNDYSQMWLVTNTKLTDDALAFSKQYNIKVVSWNYPQGESLRDIFRNSNLSPITCLTSLSSAQKQDLLQKGIVFCKDFVDSTKSSQYKDALEEANMICET